MVNDSSIKVAYWIENMGMRKPSMGLDFTYYWCITWSVLAMQIFFNGDFGTHSMSMEWFNIETSYLVNIFIINSICHQMTNYPLKWVVRVTWPKLKIRDTLHNFWMEKPTCSKFCVVIHAWSPFFRVEKKMTHKWAWLRSHERVSNIRTHFISSERLKIETSYLVHTSNIS